VSRDPFEHRSPKESPDCATCCDRGVLLDEAAEGHMGSGENCPDCNPTADQVAAVTAEYERLVAAGVIDPTADPF
jgi:hypothetical protein